MLHWFWFIILQTIFDEMEVFNKQALRFIRMNFISAALILNALLLLGDAACTESLEQPIKKATKLSFAGFNPSVNR